MNKDYKNIASLIFNQPLLCTEQYAETILAVLGDKLGIDASGYEVQSEAAQENTQNIKGDGTLVIPIYGSMTHRAGFLDAMSGIQSYEALQKKVEQGMADPNVKSILLEMDSPGGSVAGAFDFRDYILSCRGKKPIYALANDTMASAAYLIGSACDKVYTTQTGSVGSIGVVAMHMDKSQKLKDEGIKPTLLYAGKYKVAGNSNEPLKGDAKDYLQEQIQDSYEMFVNAVAEARGIDAQDIRDTEARMYRGKKAKDIGLSDGVRTLESTLEELASNFSQERVDYESMSKGKTMDKETMEQLEADVTEAKATIEKLQKDNEALRGVVISEGYVINKEGIAKKEEAKEPEMIEVAGELVEKATIPAPVLKALEAAAAEKKDAEMEAKAKEVLPNFDLSTAKVLLGMDLGEDVLQSLKSADAALASLMQEDGSASVEGDMETPQEAVDKRVKEIATSENLTKEKAFAKFASTKEGAKLIQKLYEKE